MTSVARPNGRATLVFTDRISDSAEISVGGGYPHPGPEHTGSGCTGSVCTAAGRTRTDCTYVRPPAPAERTGCRNERIPAGRLNAQLSVRIGARQRGYRLIPGNGCQLGARHRVPTWLPATGSGWSYATGCSRTAGLVRATSRRTPRPLRPVCQARSGSDEPNPEPAASRRVPPAED